jgi:tetratricopeptide (TPR) repeat protein
MGIVYKARQNTLNRIVALKMVLSGLSANPGQRQRLYAEAEAVARLQHPNIVAVFEVGEHEGQPYFSLEFCPGGSLADKLAGTALAAAEAAELTRTLAGAVHAAHLAHVVHRDLKPGNVLLAADGTPKVTDFGLAKRLDQVSETKFGAIMGSPPYMAPEQASGRIDAIGPATDVYALGAILYECLTGRPPFKAATVLETLEQVRRREPVRLRSLQPKVPRDLETICLKCLRKEPRKRYASARELADDLHRFLQGEPIHARPVPALERAVKWAKRRPTAAALAGALVLVGIFAGAGGWFFGLYKDREATVLAQQKETLEKQAKRRGKIDELVSRAKKGVADAQVALARGRDDDAVKQLGRAKEAYDGAQELIDTDFEESDAERRRDVQARRKEVERLQKDLAVRQQIKPRVVDFRKARREVLFHDFNLLWRDPAARRDKVRQLARSALKRWGVTAEQSPAEVVRALDQHRPYFASERERQEVATGCYEVLLAWAEAELPGPGAAGRVGAARRALDLLADAEALGRAHGLDAARTFHVRRARYLAQAGDDRAAAAERALAAGLRPRTALDLFLTAVEDYRQGKSEQVLATCKEVLRQQSDHTWALYLQALCHVRARNWALALAGLDACLNQEPDFRWARLLRATAHADLGEHQEAEKDFAAVLNQTSDPLERYVVLTNRGAMRVKRQRWDEALTDLRQAIELRPQMHQAYVNLAELHRARKEWAAALTALDQAIARRPGDAGLYHSRARVQAQRHDPAAARRDFEQAVRLARPGERALLARSLVELGHLKHEAGEHAAALADCDRALRVLPGYAPAHRQRAEALLTLDREAEAGQALDLYLKSPRKADPATDRKVYRVRGAIHARRGEHARALAAYDRSLALGQDVSTLNLRGWAYLQLGAVRSALADFDTVLTRQAGHAEALCGRGLARVRLGRVAEAVRDAEEAVQRGPATERLLLGAALVHARAAAQTPARRTAGRSAGRRSEDRAVELLRAALRHVPAARRAAFWRQHVQGEPALARLLSHGKMVQLARSVSR